MKLFYSATSPFVRIVMVTAHELGLVDRITLQPVSATPVDPPAELLAVNPLAKVPTLVTDDGLALYDSRVICGYLDGLAGDKALMPPEGPGQRTTEQRIALANGILDAAVLSIYEKRFRSAEQQSGAWLAGQRRKIDSALDALNVQAEGWQDARFGLDKIAVACALGYLDFRFGDADWRNGRPALAQWYGQVSERPSMTATVPSDA